MFIFRPFFRSFQSLILLVEMPNSFYITHHNANHKIIENYVTKLVKFEIYSSAEIIDRTVSRNILEGAAAVGHSRWRKVCRCVEKRLQIARRNEVRH